MTTAVESSSLEGVDWTVRHCVSLVLDAAAHPQPAAALRALSPIVDSETASAAAGVLWGVVPALYPTNTCAASAVVLAHAATSSIIALCAAVATGARPAEAAALADSVASAAVACAENAVLAGVTDHQVSWVANGTPAAIVRHLFTIAVE